MQDEKIENQLNMALEATPDERERSSSLNTGYDISDNTWEVVVRYNGGLDELYDMGIRVVNMMETATRARLLILSSL